MDRNKIGMDAEREAEQYLKQQGLKLVERNANCRFGEVDLIMLDPASDTLIFIEVRKRSLARFGGAASSVDTRKQKKLITTARFLLGKHPDWGRKNCRFDVIAYEGDSASTAPMWYKDAFRP